MKYGKKIAFLTLLAAAILLAEAPVFAATINVRNSVDRKLSLAFYYTDASKPIYYGAFN
jgi:hypothetical protein